MVSIPVIAQVVVTVWPVSVETHEQIFSLVIRETIAVCEPETPIVADRITESRRDCPSVIAMEAIIIEKITVIGISTNIIPVPVYYISRLDWVITMDAEVSPA
jgi:hypothetical protein